MSIMISQPRRGGIGRRSAGELRDWSAPADLQKDAQDAWQRIADRFGCSRAEAMRRAALWLDKVLEEEP
jgi:DNA-binding Lrp family transcriptional regulator